MNATRSPQFQTQINAALTGCEFFLKTNNANEIFATLRISPEVQKHYSWFVPTILNSLNSFEGANIIWQSKPRHGWFVIEFQSNLNHYLSLAAKNCNPVLCGRCAPSNLTINRIRTMNLLRALIERRDRLTNLIAPSILGTLPSTQSTSVVGEFVTNQATDIRQQLSAAIKAANSGDYEHSQEILNALKSTSPAERIDELEPAAHATSKLPKLPDLWETPERYPAVAEGILGRPSCPVKFSFLPPTLETEIPVSNESHNDEKEPKTIGIPIIESRDDDEESDLWQAARSAFGEWDAERRDEQRSKLQRLTKAQLGEMLGWNRGQVHNTKKAMMIEAVLDLE